MADIRVVVGKNIIKESILIHPGAQAEDRQVMDAEGKPTGQVQEANNVLAVGTNRKDALRKYYGSRF